LLRLLNEPIQRNQNMRDDVMQATLAAWATKDLSARLDVVATAKLLGFAEHDIQILMAAGKLEPLGNPAPPSGSPPSKSLAWRRTAIGSTGSA
jgi:hypothetical protein